MDAATGNGHVAAFVMSDRRRLELLQFDDGRWGIRLNDQIAGVWNSDARDDCLHAFAALCGPIEKVVLAGVKERDACNRTAANIQSN